MSSKYKEIFDYYRERMESGALIPGDVMPSEGDMAKQFGVSRDTVRKAMTLLAQNHYIGKQRGKESLVLDRTRYEYPVARIKTFTEQLKQNKQTDICETAIEDISILIGDEQAMNRLKVDEDAEVYRLIRVRKFDSERVILDKDLLLRSVVPKLTRKIASGSVYAYLEEELGLSIGLAHKIITVEKATREDMMYLDLGEEKVVAVVRSYTCLEDKRLFQYTESRYRIDYFKYEEYAHR